MEQHEGVEVGVVRCKVAGLVYGVVVVDDRRDLHSRPDAVLDHGAEGVGWRARREGELVVPVGHGLRADEDEVDAGVREEVGQLEPGRARERGLGAGAEDEESDRGRLEPEALDVHAAAGPGRVEGVAEG